MTDWLVNHAHRLVLWAEAPALLAVAVLCWRGAKRLSKGSGR